VFGVCDGITNDVFQEHLQDTTGFFVDQARDTLDSTTASQSTDGWLSDTLDVITQNFAMTLRSSFSETFSSFAATSHVEIVAVRVVFTLKVKTQMMILLTNALAFIGFSLLPLTHAKSTFSPFPSLHCN
jgi:hypothetical protein